VRRLRSSAGPLRLCHGSGNRLKLATTTALARNAEPAISHQAMDDCNCRPCAENKLRHTLESSIPAMAHEDFHSKWLASTPQAMPVA